MTPEEYLFDLASSGELEMTDAELRESIREALDEYAEPFAAELVLARRRIEALEDALRFADGMAISIEFWLSSDKFGSSPEAIREMAGRAREIKDVAREALNHQSEGGA